MKDEEPTISADEMFRKYVFDHTCNESLTQMICELNTATKDKTVVPGDPSLNDDEIFATNLFTMVPCMHLVEDICHIRDLIYGDGSRKLDIDPTYNDATVEQEARPKNKTLMWFQAVKPAGDLAGDLHASFQRMHDLKFNPMKQYQDNWYDNLSELDKLAITPVEKHPCYDRW